MNEDQGPFMKMAIKLTWNYPVASLYEICTERYLVSFSQSYLVV